MRKITPYDLTHRKAVGHREPSTERRVLKAEAMLPHSKVYSTTLLSEFWNLFFQEGLTIFVLLLTSKFITL